MSVNDLYYQLQLKPTSHTLLPTAVVPFTVGPGVVVVAQDETLPRVFRKLISEGSSARGRCCLLQNSPKLWMWQVFFPHPCLKVKHFWDSSQWKVLSLSLSLALILLSLVLSLSL